jgi:uncharacterized protein
VTESASTLTVGVLADTHLPYRLKALPSRIGQLFKDVDLILHAGDVDQIEYLAPLARVAPVHAVRGNLHLGDWSNGGRDLPEVIELNLAGRRVVLTHGHLPDWYEMMSKLPQLLFYDVLRPWWGSLNDQTARRLARLYPQADVVVFGHTHRSYRAWHNGTLFFNPGAVAAERRLRETPSVGFLAFRSGQVQARAMPLTSVPG